MMINLVLILLLVLIISININNDTFVICPPNSTEMLPLNSLESLGKAQCVINDPNDFFADLEKNNKEDLVCVGKYMEPKNGLDSVSKAWCAKKNA